MEAFIVSARKYRPATFDTVVGQQHVTNTLKNAIINNQLAQAFLFCGPRGVGKTTCARILAKTINCQNLSADGEACGVCEACVSFQNGQSFTVHELDAASNNSVDDIRSLIEQVRIPPQTGRYKVYIIDEVHMLSQAAFNAFLKTLEEPPPYAIFILATTEKHKILPTILSRCQIFDFNRIKVDDIAGHLEKIAQRENIGYDADGLHIIAQKADGGLRDALSMFDQIASFSNRNISYQSVIDNLNILDYEYFFKLTQQMLAEDVPAMLLLFDEILQHGFDGNHFIGGFSSHLRNLLVATDPQTVSLLEVSEGIKQKYLSQASQTPPSFLVSALNIANTCDLNYRTSRNQRLQVELALIKIGHLPSALSLQNEPVEVRLKKKPDSVAAEPVNVDPGKTPAKSALTQTVETKPSAEAEKSVTKSAPEEGTAAITEELPPEKTSAKEAPDENEPAAVVQPGPEKTIAKSALTGSLKIPTIAEIKAKKLAGAGGGADKMLTGEGRNTVSQEDLTAEWNRYAAEMKALNKISLFTLMTAHAPVIKPDSVIEVSVEGAFGEQEIRAEKINLLNHLRAHFQNFALDLIFRVVESAVKKQLYTSQEKYQHMAEKNPNLAELRKRFNLDIDY